MLLDPSVLADPYDFYRTLREQAPVWPVPGTDVVAISSFALLSEAVTRTEDFSSTMPCLLYRDEDGLPARLAFGDAATPTLAAADPPLHTTHRRAVFPELVARRMRALEDDIRALSATTVASALRDNNFDFMATIGNIVPITVVAKLIGFRDTNPMQLLEAAFDSTTMVGGTMPLDRAERPRHPHRRHPGVDRRPVMTAADADDDGHPAGGAAGAGRRHLADGRGADHPAHPAQRGRGVDDQPARQRRPDACRGPRVAATATR